MYRQLTGHYIKHYTVTIQNGQKVCTVYTYIRVIQSAYHVNALSHISYDRKELIT